MEGARLEQREQHMQRLGDKREHSALGKSHSIWPG